MNSKVLSKDIRVENNKIVITENVETKLDINNLYEKLTGIQMYKEKILNQNKNLIEDYKRLVREEEELNNQISKLDRIKLPEEI